MAEILWVENNARFSGAGSPVRACLQRDRGNAALIAAGADVVCAKTHFANIDAVVIECLRARSL